MRTLPNGLPAVSAIFRAVRRALPLLAIFAALLAMPARPAAAQGTMGQFPDPISTAELNRLLERYIGVRPEQWDLIERTIDDYQAQFRALRDGDMQRVLDASGAMQGVVPGKAQIEELMRQTDRVTVRIRTLDERLFDQIAVTLDEGQLASLQRVRQARERRRHVSGQAVMWVGGGVPPDLSALVLDMNLTPAERLAVDPILLSYEPALTRATAALHEAGSRMLVDMVDAMEQAGMANMTQEEFMENPERLTEMMALMQAAWASIAERSKAATRNIRDLNHRTRRQLVLALAGERGRDFQGIFLKAAYPGLARDAQRSEGLLEMALATDGLEPVQREAIEAMRAQHRSADDRIVEDLIKHTDDQMDAMNPMEFDPSESEASEQLRELTSRRNALLANLRTNLEPLVGPDALDERKAHARRMQAEAEAGADLEALATVAMPAVSGDASVPGPIAVAELAKWVGRMNLESGQRVVLDALHADYLQEWETTVRPLVTAIGSAYTEQRNDDGEFVFTHTPAVVRTVHDRRTKAIAAAQELDRRFVADAASALASGDDIGRFELLALSLALTGSQGTYLDVMDANREARVNIVEVLLDGNEDADVRPIVERILLDHAPALREAHRNVTLAMRDSQLAMELMGAEFSQAGSDPAKMAEISQSMQERTAAASRRVTEAVTARRAVNHRILDELRGALRPERFTAINRAYRHAAWPTIYGASSSPLPLIERALSFSDLSDAQRAALESVRSDAERDYDAICDKLVEASADPMAADFSSPEHARRWMDRQQQMERLRFEQREIASRAVRRTNGILTEEQLSRLPGLAAFLDRSGDRRWFDPTHSE